MYIPSVANIPAIGLCRIRRRASLRVAWCLALAAFVVSRDCPVAAQV